MRESCLFCVCKHLSQAQVLMSESAKGYPYHKWLAVGHLAEAEDESIDEYPDLTKKIRTLRLAIMEQEGVFKAGSIYELLKIAAKRLMTPASNYKEAGTYFEEAKE